jgi:hypothetical protein
MSTSIKTHPISSLKGLTLYIAAGCLLLASCSKSFTSASDALVGQPPSTAFWKTADDATKAVNAMYGNLRTWNNTAFAAIAIENTASDDAVKGSTSNDATFFNQYDNFTVDPSEGQLGGFWGGQYVDINFCNQVLDNVPNINMDGSLKARYLAEAKFVRAYSYFRLERAFGNIPLVIHVPDSAAALNPKQNTPAEIWAAIEQDLTDAAAGLPVSYGPSDIGRATKGAALALHAKVAMYQKKWSDVLNYSNQVIALNVYDLLPDFYQEFRYANENSVESVFEIQCDYVPNNDDINSSQYSQVQGNRDASPSAGWGFNVPTQNLVDEFETGDPRLTGTVMFAGTTTPSGDNVPMPAAGAPDKYNMKSYVPFPVAILSGNPGCGQNVRVLRFSDVLLMNAEALNETGATAQALIPLERVRARARAKSTDPSTDLPAVTSTDQATVRNAIYHERRVELAMENDRYFDVIRQGRADTVFGPLGWKANKNEVWPIPQTEIDNSGNVLKQNTGY